MTTPTATGCAVYESRSNNSYIATVTTYTSTGNPSFFQISVIKTVVDEFINNYQITIGTDSPSYVYNYNVIISDESTISSKANNTSSIAPAISILGDSSAITQAVLGVGGRFFSKYITIWI